MLGNNCDLIENCCWFLPLFPFILFFLPPSLNLWNQIDLIKLKTGYHNHSMMFLQEKLEKKTHVTVDFSADKS